MPRLRPLRSLAPFLETYPHHRQNWVWVGQQPVTVDSQWHLKECSRVCVVCSGAGFPRPCTAACLVVGGVPWVNNAWFHAQADVYGKRTRPLDSGLNVGHACRGNNYTRDTFFYNYWINSQHDSVPRVSVYWIVFARFSLQSWELADQGEGIRGVKGWANLPGRPPHWGTSKHIDGYVTAYGDE